MADWKIDKILNELHENRERQERMDDAINALIFGTQQRLEMAQYIQMSQAKYN